MARTKKLAQKVVKYCLNVKQKENIVISNSSGAEPFIESLYKELILAKAKSFSENAPKKCRLFLF